MLYVVPYNLYLISLFANRMDIFSDMRINHKMAVVLGLIYEMDLQECITLAQGCSHRINVLQQQQHAQENSSTSQTQNKKEKPQKTNHHKKKKGQHNK